MSHFSEMKVDHSQTYESELIAALESVFGKGSVEVHEDGAALYGYTGDNRSEKSAKSKDYAPPCHLIIRRGTVGPGANDVGYRRTEEGGYVAYVSDYDKDHTFTSTKRDKVMQDYASRVSEKQLKKQGYSVKRTVTSDGVIKLTATKY